MGPVVKLESQARHLVYQAPRVIDPEYAEVPGSLWSQVLHKDPPPIHPSFLLFDFKYLRRWPNVAGDISRSPPFLPAP